MKALLILLIALGLQSQERIPIGNNVTRPEEFMELAEDPSIRGYNEDYTEEAVAAGFGTSKLDRKIEFTPGMDLEAARREVRNGNMKDLFTILIIGGLSAIIIVIAIYSSVKEKKKESE